MTLSLTRTIATWLRDYNTDGMPASGAKNPVKSESRTWGTEIEAWAGTVDAALAAGFGLTNTRLAKTAAYTLANADKGKTVALGGTSFYALTIPAAAGFDANFSVRLINEDKARCKTLLLARGTSTTSLAIATGSKAFTTQSGLNIPGGNTRVRAYSAANNANWMSGIATYSSTTLTITVDTVGGSGTLNDWVIAQEKTLCPLQTATLYNDNSVWQLDIEKRWRLYGDLTVYVDGTNGLDANDGFASGAGNAFKTIQRAVDFLANDVDIGGATGTSTSAISNTVVIQVADGTYTQTVQLKTCTGEAILGNHTEIYIRGNMTTPANVLISTTLDCFISVGCPTPWRLEGMKVVSSTQCGINSHLRSVIYWGKMEFGACAVAHIQAGYGAICEMVDDYIISGNAAYHVAATQQSLIILYPSKSAVLVGSLTIGIYAFADGQSQITAQSTIFGGGGSVTGTRYQANKLGLIDTGGGGASFFPGTSGGSANTGSQYV